MQDFFRRLAATRPIQPYDSLADAAAVENGHAMPRVLGVFDLVMLSIGAVIGAGIFGSIGTAAAGEISPTGEVVRYGAGPALVVSFLLLGVVCGLCALCYAELASMIPHAGSAYAYAYATLGELVAWIIGWDLILEYAVGNVAVAISWAGYFESLLSVFGIHFPPYLTHGYFDAVRTPEGLQMIANAPHIFGVPCVLNLPAFAIVMFVTALLLVGVKESTRANNIMVGIKLIVLTLFVGFGATKLNFDYYTPFAPNGFRGIHQGAAIAFFAYIGFDAISTAAEETKNPQTTMPRGILYGLGICTVVYIVVGAVITGLAPWRELGTSDPLAYALRHAQMPVVGWLISLGAVISYTAVLLVFQYGQPRILFAMARDGLLPASAAKLHPRFKTPFNVTLWSGILVALASLVADDEATYDLTNIGTLFAFLIVCIGVLVLRYRAPDAARPFKVPLVWIVAPLGAAACLFTMAGLPVTAWKRFAVWLVIGLALYFVYGYGRSRLNPLRHSDAQGN